MSNRRVAIYGGAFNPVHIDHINLAKGLIDCGHVDAVYLMPCYDHFHSKSLASAQDRLSLVEEACAHLKRDGYSIHACDIEINLKSNGSLYDLLQQADFSEYGDEIYFVIGMDNANGIDRWKNWRWLIANVNFITVHRTGLEFASADLLRTFTSNRNKVVNMQERVAGCSSSLVRHIIATEGAKSRKLKALLPTGVLEEIQLYNLYV